MYAREGVHLLSSALSVLVERTAEAQSAVDEEDDFLLSSLLPAPTVNVPTSSTSASRSRGKARQQPSAGAKHHSADVEKRKRAPRKVQGSKKIRKYLPSEEDDDETDKNDEEYVDETVSKKRGQRGRGPGRGRAAQEPAAKRQRKSKGKGKEREE